MSSFLDKLLGRPLALSANKKQALSIWTGVPALGLDALASTAYGPEAALMILLPLGLLGLHYFIYVIIAIVIVLFFLYLSYRQTAAAYPNGGGAYIVASANLGRRAGMWAAVALLLDYLLNVAVGISAGVGAVVSALPFLQPYTLILCLIILLMLTIINLRGIRQSGLAFIIPTLVFIACLGFAMGIGLVKSMQSNGHPHPIIAPPPIPPFTGTLTIWLLLGAFANGLTAMTGVEALSNAVPLFRKPSVRNAQWTLTIIIGILALFLLALGYLCSTYHLVAMNENHPGYQTILSQLIGAVAGKGIFYYVSIASIFIILANSAQTSFADFPRVCRFLAEDSFLPHFFADQGRRLVFSHGIIVLAILSGILLIAFKGITLQLIPLFALGAFSAFLFSQIGMMVYWLRKKEGRSYIKFFCNASGAVVTAIALVIIIAAKFMQGAWIIIVFAAILVFFMSQIRRHYAKIAHEIEKPLTLKMSELKPPVVIIPIQGLDCIAERAIQFGMLLSDDITAVCINTGDNEVADRLKILWTEKVEKPAKAANKAVPRLQIIKSPYRRIYKPILNFVEKIKKEKPDRLIAIIIPELIEPHWYEYLLHNVYADVLRALLFLKRDQRAVVITIPWYLRESAFKR